MKCARLTTTISAAMLAAVLMTHAQSKDPLLGTWTLNAAKSKYTPGPVPKSTTSIYEAAGKGYKITVKSETGGGAVQYSYTTYLDGKDSKVIGNNPNADTIGVKRIDARTLEAISKKGGKVTITQRNVVSADGKTRTVTTTGTDGFGQKVHNIALFERKDS